MPIQPPITAIVTPDLTMQRQLQEALDCGSMTESVWSLSDYPELSDLERLKTAQSGCILFLDFVDTVRARRIAAEIDRAYPTVSVVALYDGASTDELIALMQLGVREVIGNPISSSSVAVAFGRASKKLKPAEAPGGDIIAFLPAQPGSGSTTVATSTAAAVARMSGRTALLLDFDLRLGITSFLLKLDGRHSVQDALNESSHLDEDFWVKMVTSRDTLDILGSAPSELPSEPQAEEYMALLNWAQGRYASIFVDLPGAMERHELETLNRAKEILLVFKADMTGLHMAKRKSEALRRLQHGDKVSALINQAEGRATLPLSEVEKLLQMPVRFTLPRDEKTVAEAVLHGSAVEPKSKLGAQIEALAKSLTGTPVARPTLPAAAGRFLEHFSVAPARDRNRWGF
jgi:Flp pilus assembly CpaE family ATPase